MIVGTNHPVRACQCWDYEDYTPPRHNPFWELIVSPNDEMPIHRFFEFADIQTNYDPNSPQDNWTPGTVFRHRKTGKVIEVYKKIKKTVRKGHVITRIDLRLRVVKPSDQLELIPLQSQ